MMAQKTPIILSDNRTQHIPLADDDTVRVSDIPISPDSGNQIQKRDNGLYYGQVAPADISSLYVSNQGNDSNPGTKDAPLRTIEKAAEIVATRDVGGTYTVRLKAGQTFAPQKYAYFGTVTKQIVFSFYDDPIFGEATGGNGFWVVADSRLQRPKIIFNTMKLEDGLVHRVGPDASVSSQITFQGVDAESKSDSGQDVGGAAFMYPAKLDFQGSTLTLSSEVQTFGSATNILLRQCDYVNNTKNGHLFIGDYSPQLFQQTLITPGQTYKDPLGKLPDIIAKTTNLATTLKVANVVGLASYDVATKTMFGWNANWDIFANG